MECMECMSGSRNVVPCSFFPFPNKGHLMKIDAFHYIQLGTVYRCVLFLCLYSVHLQKQFCTVPHCEIVTAGVWIQCRMKRCSGCMKELTTCPWTKSVASMGRSVTAVGFNAAHHFQSPTGIKGNECKTNQTFSSCLDIFICFLFQAH